MTRNRIFKAALLVLLLAAAGAAHGQHQELLARADELHREERHGEVISLLRPRLEEAKGEARKAEVLWRLSRAHLNKTVLELFTGLSEDTALEQLSTGVERGRRAVELCPECARAYFWEAANMGKRGELRGIMNSLFLAGDIRDLVGETVRRQPEYPNSYYLLGQLYDKLPGWPISFGSGDKAVSLGRLSVDLHERQLQDGGLEVRYHDYYTQLARHLWARNWSSARRLRKQKDKRESRREAESELERAFLYEANVELAEISDREEARQILEETIHRLEGFEDPGVRQDMDLAAARETRSQWDR